MRFEWVESVYNIEKISKNQGSIRKSDFDIRLFYENILKNFHAVIRY